MWLKSRKDKSPSIPTFSWQISRERIYGALLGLLASNGYTAKKRERENGGKRAWLPRANHYLIVKKDEGS